MPEDAERATEQQHAEAEVEGFRQELGPFVVAAETTRMPMVFTDAKAAGHPIIFVNRAFLDLTGHEQREVLAQPFDFLIESETDPAALADIRKGFEENSERQPVLRFRRKDASKISVAVYINAVRDSSGDVVQHFCSFIDVTRHKDEENRLRFLLDELNHRTQNTLGTVLAIARQTLRGGAEAELFKERVLALAKAQSLLGSADWHRVGLRDVIERILEPFGLNDLRSTRFAVRGGDVRLRPKAALTLAMVFHELATNAVKHGALSDDGAGRVEIAWQVDLIGASERLRLSWRETGGPVVAPPGRRGFGSRLIEQGLAQEVDGEVHLDFEPSGVVCRIVMPVSKGDGWRTP